MKGGSIIGWARGPEVQRWYCVKVQKIGTNAISNKTRETIYVVDGTKTPRYRLWELTVCRKNYFDRDALDCIHEDRRWRKSLYNDLLRGKSQHWGWMVGWWRRWTGQLGSSGGRTTERRADCVVWCWFWCDVVWRRESIWVVRYVSKYLCAI